MAGTGDIDVMRRLRLLHGRANADIPYGSHLAIHMALGALFLGGGSMTFGTSNLAIASLICAFYPLFPMDVTDNKAHLQPFRHMWVLATDSRCVVTRDVDTNRAIRVPLTLTLRDGTRQKLTAPCLLPELEGVDRIETSGREYWPITLDFANNPNHLAAFESNQTLHVRRRPASQAYSNVFSTTLVSLNDSQSKSLIGARKVFGSVFRLSMFGDLSFELSDVGLVLPVDERSSMWLDSRGSVVDDKLTLIKSAARGTDRDMLWNLRLLFKWAEWAAEKGEGGIRWLGKDVIENLRGVIEERARRQQLEEGGGGL
jgi:anaphase-promoting complex subunit 1